MLCLISNFFFIFFLLLLLLWYTLHCGKLLLVMRRSSTSSKQLHNTDSSAFWKSCASVAHLHITNCTQVWSLSAWQPWGQLGRGPPTEFSSHSAARSCLMLKEYLIQFQMVLTNEGDSDVLGMMQQCWEEAWAPSKLTSYLCRTTPSNKWQIFDMINQRWITNPRKVCYCQVEMPITFQIFI